MNSKNRTLIIAIAGLTAVVVIVSLFWRSGSVKTAPVILPTPQAGSEPADTYYNVSGRADVTAETVQAVIRTLDRADAYTRTVTVDDFWTGGGGSAQLKEWSMSGSTRIRIESAAYAENILLSGGQLYIWYDKSEGVYQCDSDTAPSTADRWLRCLTYEDLLGLDTQEITGAGYVQYAGESCIWASYLSEGFGYRNVVYVSVSKGLLMGSESYDGDELIYRMTSGAPDMTAPDASWFVPPESAA